MHYFGVLSFLAMTAYNETELHSKGNLQCPQVKLLSYKTDNVKSVLCSIRNSNPQSNSPSATIKTIHCYTLHKIEISIYVFFGKGHTNTGGL